MVDTQVSAVVSKPVVKELSAEQLKMVQGGGIRFNTVAQGGKRF